MDSSFFRSRKVPAAVLITRREGCAACAEPEHMGWTGSADGRRHMDDEVAEPFIIHVTK